MRGELVIPEELAGRAELHNGIGVQVRTRSAAGPWVACPPALADRAGVRDANVKVALCVEGRRIPETAARVDGRVAPEILHLIPRPLWVSGAGVQRPQGPLGAAEVLPDGRVNRHGRHVHGAVVVAGSHVNTLAVVGDQRAAPQL